MVVVGEDLEKPKSILELDVKPDLDNSTPDCAISTNPTPLPETDGMEAPSFTPDSSIVELDGTEGGKQGAFIPRHRNASSPVAGLPRAASQPSMNRRRLIWQLATETSR